MPKNETVNFEHASTWDYIMTELKIEVLNLCGEYGKWIAPLADKTGFPDCFKIFVI